MPVHTLHTIDGTRLAATFTAAGPAGALLLHGAGMTRDEGGFYVRLASALASAGVASLRVDLPGHGDSSGRQPDLSLSGLLNAIDAGLAALLDLCGAPSAGIVAASMSGGVSAHYAAARPELVDRLVLLNPLLDYRSRFALSRPWWSGTRLSPAAARELDDGLPHSPTFRLGRAMINEVFWLRPELALPAVLAPTLVVHGTLDSIVPVASSRRLVSLLRVAHRLVEIPGAEHGFPVAGLAHEHPRSRACQARVRGEVVRWLTPASATKGTMGTSNVPKGTIATPGNVRRYGCGCANRRAG